MQSIGTANRNFRINIIFLLVATVLAYHLTQFRFSVNLMYEQAMPLQLVNGVAETPYQFRVLLPWLVRAIGTLPLVPAGSELGIFQLLEFLALVLLATAFRTFLLLFVPSRAAASVLALTLFYLLPFNLLYTYWYPYDVPAVLFFVLGLTLLYRRQWGWYYPLFVLATLNRETAVFLTAVFVLTSWGKLPIRQIATHTAAQLLIWAAIKLAVQSLYPNNPGATFQWTLENNLELLTQPFAILWLLTNWGMTWVVLLIGWRWLTDIFLRRALLVTIPVLGVMFLVGKVDELRIYAELTPLILTAVILILTPLFRQEVRADSLTRRNECNHLLN